MKEILSVDFSGKGKEDSENHKKPYIPPSVSVMWIEMEQGIVIESVMIKPNPAGQVTTDYAGDNDQTEDVIVW